MESLGDRLLTIFQISNSLLEKSSGSIKFQSCSELRMSQSVVIKKEDVVFMLTRDVAETIDARIVHDSEFAIALLNEAVSLFLNGEPETARLVLRDLVNAISDCALGELR
jgi:hypothetical protein